MSIRQLKADLHTHTSEDPCDSMIAHSSVMLIDEAARQGYEVLAITNHDSQHYSTELFEYAMARGVLLIKGMELTYEGQHIVLLNFDDAGEIKGPDDIMRRKGDKNLVIAPHPYFMMSYHCRDLLDNRPELFDAVEYAHLYTSFLNFNERAVKRAGELGLPLIGTSDAHTLVQMGHTYTLIEAEKTVESVVAAVKAGHVELVTKPLSLFKFLGIIGLMKYWSMKRSIGELFSAQRYFR